MRRISDDWKTQRAGGGGEGRKGEREFDEKMGLLRSVSHRQTPLETDLTSIRDKQWQSPLRKHWGHLSQSFGEGEGSESL